MSGAPGKPIARPADVVISDTAYIRLLERLDDMARQRSQSPAETLAAALDALGTGPITDARIQRLRTLAGSRSQTLDELVGDMIGLVEEVPRGKTRNLEAGVVVPDRKPPMHPDGEPYCKCPGPYEYGPHHTCERHRHEMRAEGDFS